MIDYPITELDLKLHLTTGVFQPNTTTQLLVKHMGDVKGKVVLDLGCGAGPIAISAALKGAEKVYAVDIMPEACETTIRNAELNGVSDRVVVLHGNLFEPVKGLKFDIIIDDVSGMAEEVSRISPWYPETIPTGGRDGTVPTVLMLQSSPSFLNSGGYLLFPIISLSRSESILSAAMEVYGDRLHQIVNKFIPFCNELIANIELLERLKNEGITNFIQKRSRYLWNLAIYKADA